MKTVVTMTSHPQRINYILDSLKYFNNTQIEKPDIFYLWLSVEEFPCKESSLSADLVSYCNANNITIRWTEKNEYCHKRWYVYPEHYEDLVISIDDDTFYDQNLIKFAKELSGTHSIYNLFGNRTYYSLYQGIRFLMFCNTTDSRPSIYKAFLGQCIIPPKVFPLEAVTPKNIQLRQKYCKICDQCWLTPFIKYHEIKVGYLPFRHNENFVVSETCKTYNRLSKNVLENIQISDVQLYIALRLFPDMMRKFRQLFPSYIAPELDGIPVDDLLELIKYA